MGLIEILNGKQQTGRLAYNTHPSLSSLIRWTHHMTPRLACSQHQTSASWTLCLPLRCGEFLTSRDSFDMLVS